MCQNVPKTTENYQKGNYVDPLSVYFMVENEYRKTDLHQYLAYQQKLRSKAPL